MKVLLIGSGGREHALAWKLVQSGKVTELLVAPGSDGIAQLQKVRCVPIAATAIDELRTCAIREGVSLTVVGPEAPLVAGIVDRFREKGLGVFGPTRDAAQLEGSKTFAKRLMQERHIPTARQWHPFDDMRKAIKFIHQSGVPWVVKADGLAGGKGVVVASTVEDTVAAVRRIMQDQLFGEAGKQIVLEERLVGEEASVIGIADGHHALVLELEAAQDHKRLKDGDTGPNTGGMGAYSPPPVVDETCLARVHREILKPTVMGMAMRGIPSGFSGFLYAGLMITAEGPMVLEYNVRLGDPEAQAILPRLKTDLAQVLLKAVGGFLDQVKLEWHSEVCVCVVLAADGYPDKPVSGDKITGLSNDGQLEFPLRDVQIFHAGTRRESGHWITSGGRVLNVVALGSTVQDARDRAYKAADQIQFKGKQYRTDIGARAVAPSALRSV